MMYTGDVGNTSLSFRTSHSQQQQHDKLDPNPDSALDGRKVVWAGYLQQRQCRA